MMSLAYVTYAQSSNIDFGSMRRYEATAVSATGEVTRVRDDQRWALGQGERARMQDVIATGEDGYARFDAGDGSSFELLSNSRVVFRRNAANPADILDVLGGRVRIHLQPNFGAEQRIFCPVAIVSAHEPATVAMAVDEDDRVRIDVIEGEIYVQHRFLPRSAPVLIHSVDAILVEKGQPISWRVDRGSLYHMTLKSLRGVLSAITFGHPASHNTDEHAPDANRFLAEARGIR